MVEIGTTACKWDNIIPFDEMWKRLNKLTKSDGAIVLFGNGIFSSNLKISNINFKENKLGVKSYILASNFDFINNFQYNNLEKIYNK